MFAPLPVFIRGGETYARLEPDFVIIKDGVVLLVEVDGDTFHHESPVDAHERLRPLSRAGAMIERVRASECQSVEKAQVCAARLIEVIEQTGRRR